MLASPSSEMDELGMDLAPNLQRKSGGNVKTIVKDYEAKTKIATSLEPRVSEPFFSCLRQILRR